MHATPRHRPRDRRSTERGIALVFVTFAMAALLVAITGALVTGTSNSQAATNYKGSSQAHFAAEAALSEAVQRINRTGIIDFQNDVIDDWSNRWGSTWHAAPLTGFSYTVTPVANVANPTKRGRLVARATGPGNLSNAVVAEVVRTDEFSTAPGAIYLATDQTVNPTFNGNNFHIDGNDHSYLGGSGPGTPVPGLSTRSQPNTSEVISELGSGQFDNIVGLGFQNSSPPVPSVMTSAWAPSIDQMNDFIDDLLTLPHTTMSDSQLTPATLAGRLGNLTPPPAVPALVYSTGTVEVKGAGNIQGSGIWIVEGDLIVTGTLNYAGLIIVRGKTTVKQQIDDGLEVTGNATVYGSIWSQDVDFTASGSSIVNYSTDALALANQVSGGHALPTTIKVLAMADCATVVSNAVTGCP